MNRATGDTFWRTAARAREAGLEPQKTKTSTHDLGFMLLDSFGNDWRVTGSEHARDVALTAAQSLATRYSPVVRMTRSLDNPASADPDDFMVLVDNMMNIELLFWAARHGGDPALATYATRHAVRTAVEHVRPDGSTNHLVVFDADTGAVKDKRTVQGYSDSSTWARGQAWAIDGFATAFRETRDPRFLAVARRTADWFLDHLPADHVPRWDFNAPGGDQQRDSSAAAIAADGLLALAQLDPDAANRRRWYVAAQAILKSLSSPAYLAEGTASRSILLHGTADKPHGNYDTGLIYGDYFFLQALLRYRALRAAETGKPPPQPKPPPARPLRVSLSGLAKPRRLRRALRRGVKVTVRLSAPGRLSGALFRRGRSGKRVRVARGHAKPLRAGGARVTLRFTRKWRRRLGSSRRVRLRVRVGLVDGAGRHAHATGHVVLLRR
jgi:unsaturated chondroitin disaccharide hydrolase